VGGGSVRRLSRAEARSYIFSYTTQADLVLLLKYGARNLAKRLMLFDILTGSQPETVIEILNSAEDKEVVPLAIYWLDCKGYQEKRLWELLQAKLYSSS
jgi:hypothetical protein